MSGSCGVIFFEYCELLDGYLKVRENYKMTKFCKINRMSLFHYFECIIRQLLDSACA